MATDSVVRTLRYGDHPDHVSDLSSPGGTPCGTIVLIHGGYWRARFTRELMVPLVEPALERGWEVANLEYRRVGDGGGWPASTDDVSAGLRSIRGATPGPICLIGHSVGGHAALLHHELADAVIALAPVTDLVGGAREGIGDGAVADFLGITAAGPLDAPGLSLANAASPAVPGKTPTLIVHGADDQRVPVAHTRDFVARSRKAGAPVDYLELAAMPHLALIDPRAAHWGMVWTWLDATLAARSPR